MDEYKNNQTEYYMEAAIKEAETAYQNDEVPVGAVLVLEDKIIGRGYNSVIKHSDPSAHAEILALRRAGEKVGNYRLNGCEMYVTLEPCLMCFSALVNARIKKLVFSAFDAKTGIFSTGKFDLVKDIYNHTIEVESGCLEERSSELLKKFFKERRDAGAVERDGLENR